MLTFLRGLDSLVVIKLGNLALRNEPVNEVLGQLANLGLPRLPVHEFASLAVPLIALFLLEHLPVKLDCVLVTLFFI